MMRIDALSNQPDRAGRYAVQFEDGTGLRLYRQTVEDFGLYAGKMLTDEELSQLHVAAGRMSAKMRAVRIVSSASISKGELERRLVQKGESSRDAQEAVDWMTELDLLDDRKTAQQIVQRCIGRGYGLARAKQALYEKRIPKLYWEEVLADYPDQTVAIVAFLSARLSDGCDEKDLRRVTDALLRKGHSYQEIRRALNIYMKNADFQEDFYG